jgi:pectate lyase
MRCWEFAVSPPAPPPPPPAALVLLFASLLTTSLGFCACAAGGGDTNMVGMNRNPGPSPLVSWPRPTKEIPVDRTIRIRGSFDGGMARYYGVDDLGTNTQEEDQGPLFVLEDGATISNVILGDPAADGIHCRAACTLNNVWWERVGEDAATFRGTLDSQVSTVNGGGASGALDKVFQHNGAGTLVIKNFYVEWFGKLYRSCGNCSMQQRRRVIIENVTAVTGPKSRSLAGVNENFGDSAEFRGVSTIYDGARKFTVCLRYLGNNRNLEPREIGDGPDGRACLYDGSSVVVHRAPPPAATARPGG